MFIIRIIILALNTQTHVLMSLLNVTNWFQSPSGGVYGQVQISRTQHPVVIQGTEHTVYEQVTFQPGQRVKDDSDSD